MGETVRTHEIAEIEPGVFYSILEPCSAAVLPYVLAPDAAHVWLVDHSPDERLLWTALPVPIKVDGPVERLLVRGVRYDLQMPTPEFLARIVPRLGAGCGLRLLQLDRPVPDSLRYHDIEKLPAKYAVLRQNGWRLSFDLPHGGEYAELTAPDRNTLEAILADPVVAAGKVAGDLP